MNRLDEIESRLDALEKQAAAQAATLANLQAQAKADAEQFAAIQAVLAAKPVKAQAPALSRKKA